MATLKKVLIAEDSSVIQNLTRKILQAQNFEIFSAKNGKQVIDMIKKDDYDIILMDINMPIMNGIECTKQIRAMEEENKKDIPIVAITGNAMNYTLEEFKEAGINDYLQKPLNFDTLVEVVKTLTE